MSDSKEDIGILSVPGGGRTPEGRSPADFSFITGNQHTGSVAVGHCGSHPVVDLYDCPFRKHENKQLQRKPLMKLLVVCLKIRVRLSEDSRTLLIQLSHRTARLPIRDSDYRRRK